ncbi:MAG TPA: DUF4440 domain-containing protein [Casimicrobium huifangae]|jgi:hypothetical protein|nr:DUF4440 domain-containing protein [Casimicrobium huifangae]HQD66145.1 DUF4440 domain-containing protein [Casimicrobium huifangae]
MQESRSQAQIDMLIADFFAAFDNRDGRIPQKDTVERLFSEKAVISVHREGLLEIFSTTDFITPRIRLLTNGDLVDFYEWEETASTQVAGEIAARTSRYSKLGTYKGLPYSGSGTKFFHLARLPSGWRIVALLWTDDA